MGTTLILAAIATVLLVAAVAGGGSGKGGPDIKTLASKGLLLLGCISAAAYAGISHHTGQDFWQKLTVHDQQQSIEPLWRNLWAAMVTSGWAALEGLGLKTPGETAVVIALHLAACTLPVLILGFGVVMRCSKPGSSGLWRLERKIEAIFEWLSIFMVLPR
jgi:hypothetical protein